ncbi:hypothetical protein HPB51_000133 [Rhipicephalus microplus]|uniref:THAP-type domain-containing protein n=1 Tax=Rhipicephalus microplus TaxID=6941 RepID=A0A9J6EKL1_RHIMP|nr:hypothetical protein HPB51_000133 [Rhipicephalus microplus]
MFSFRGFDAVRLTQAVSTMGFQHVDFAVVMLVATTLATLTRVPQKVWRQYQAMRTPMRNARHENALANRKMTATLKRLPCVRILNAEVMEQRKLAVAVREARPAFSIASRFLKGDDVSGGRRFLNRSEECRRRGKKTQRWCFVPGCDAGYKSCGERLSLFRTPAREDEFEKWARAIPRADKPLQEKSAVCERHFDPRCISFYSLAKSLKGANVSPGLLEALLSEDHLLSENEAPACDDVTLPVEAAEVAIGHADYVEKRSDDRLTYYIAGYVARKRIFSTQCEACKDACLVTRDSVTDKLPAEACKKWDMTDFMCEAGEAPLCLTTATFAPSMCSVGAALGAALEASPELARLRNDENDLHYEEFQAMDTSAADISADSARKRRHGQLGLTAAKKKAAEQPTGSRLDASGDCSTTIGDGFPTATGIGQCVTAVNSDCDPPNSCAGWTVVACRREKKRQKTGRPSQRDPP